MKDALALRGQSAMLNVVLRGSPTLDGTGRYVVFGFVLNMPVDLMQRSNGKDIHLLAQVSFDAVETGTKPLEHTWRDSCEDILERGIPAFNDDR